MFRADSGGLWTPQKRRNFELRENNKMSFEGKVAETRLQCSRRPIATFEHRVNHGPHIVRAAVCRHGCYGNAWPLCRRPEGSPVRHSSRRRARFQLSRFYSNVYVFLLAEPYTYADALQLQCSTKAAGRAHGAYFP